MWARTCTTYWSNSDRVSVSTAEIQQTSSSYLCLLRCPLCVYWLGTTWHWELSTKFRFTKGWAGGDEVCMHGRGSMDLLMQTDAAALERLRSLAWAFVPPPSFQLIVHWRIKQLYNMLRDVKKTGLLYCNSLRQSKKNRCLLNTHSDLTDTAPPCNCLLQGGKALTKRVQGQDFPWWDHHLH